MILAAKNGHENIVNLLIKNGTDVNVKNEKGNTIKVSFGDPNLSIKRDNPERKKSFRARHNCDNPGPRTSARYWSCRYWSKTPVSKMD